MIPLARKDTLLIETLPDEIIIYDKARNAAHCLNRSVKWIWEQCDGLRTVQEIAAEFEQTFGVPNALSVVSSGLDQLAAADLVTGVPRTVPVGRMTRRAAVALGASAIPIVTSIVVPTPAAAQSRQGPEANGKAKAKGKE